MNDIAIRVENLSKSYRIGTMEEIPDTFAGSIASFLKAPINNFKNLRQLNTFESGTSQESADESVFWALRDVSFDVRHGEVIGIIGRNGAGKSTLLKILTRITEPTSGRARIQGRVSSLLEVGTGFHPELSGHENIYMNGTILGMRKKEIDAKYDEIVEFSGVEKFLATPIKRYSSGMKVRLAFAVAAHLEPEILIIDEVLAVGDAEFQKKCLGKMQNVATGGRTVLFVSHNMSAIQNLCGRCIYLNAGQVVTVGDTAKTIEYYLRSASNASHTVDLTSVEDRNGNGKAQSSKIELCLTDGTPSNHIPMGHGLLVNLSLITTETSIKTVVGIAIYDRLGRRICGLNSSDTQRAVFVLNKDEQAIVKCIIPNMNLMPGTYHMNIVIQDPLSRETLDSVSDAIAFEVFAVDVYGTGHVPKGESMVYLPVKWEHLRGTMHEIIEV